MNKIRIDQFSAGFNPGDAISNEMLYLKNFFESKGIKGEIYSENIGTNARSSAGARKYKSWKEDRDTAVIYHHSIHSGVSDFILNMYSSIPKFMIYHNVTPHSFFEPYDYRLAGYLKRGRQELHQFRDIFRKSFAVSEFNRKDLIEAGFKNSEVFPFALNFYNYKKLGKNTDGKKKILFVGRIAPNKKQTDLLKAAHIFRKYTDIPFEFRLVGFTSRESILYRHELDWLISSYSLSENVRILEFASQEDLFREYSEADAFLCLSEHEGFCVPLLEAMYYDIPVAAFDAGAISETLGKSGILFKEKNYLLISSILEKILTDSEFRENILRSQRKRLEEYSISSNPEILLKKITESWNTGS